MFERYTEKARRVIFFARYEASQYGSPYIDTEHLLLGLVREDPVLVRTFLGDGDVQTQIRTEVVERFTPRERISTSVEMPLTTESKKILMLAGEESARLGHRHIGTEHLLLGMLGAETSVAGRLLQARGLKAVEVREKVAKTAPTSGIAAATSDLRIEVRQDEIAKARLKLDNFLAGLKWEKAEALIEFFAVDARFIDVLGNIWNREEMQTEFGTLFAPYAKKNAAPHVEETLIDQGGQFVAVVLWKNAVLASLERIWIHRMSVVWVRVGVGWRILLMQVTPVQFLQVKTQLR